MFTKISIDQAKELLDKGGLAIFDIRDSSTFQKAHIENAQWLSKDNFDQLQTLTQDTPILVYCYRGNSSQAVAELLVKMGFKTVYSMNGGFELWSQKYPIV